MADLRSREAEAYRALYKTARWQRLRKQKLAEKPLCERHLKKGRVKAATVVNHRQPHKGNKDLFYSYANLEAVCDTCHNSTIQSEERLGYSKEIGEDGWPTDENHPLYVKR